MSKYIELETFDNMWAFGVTLNILRPETYLVVDFYKWQLRIGKLA